MKKNGIVKAYAANTNQGLVRNYNEDRVSIILNIMKPANRKNENWPKCSFFGVYDGRKLPSFCIFILVSNNLIKNKQIINFDLDGGINCADFLRDNLH